MLRGDVRATSRRFPKGREQIAFAAHVEDVARRARVGLELLAQVVDVRFEFIYTPKSASWLNMIECEFSVISRQCLDRRIAAIEHLSTEVLALLEERSAKAIKIHWQFSIQAARSKLNSHYSRVNATNQQYKET